MGNIDPYVTKAKASALQLSQPQRGPAAEGGNKAAADLLDALSGSSRSKQPQVQNRPRESVGANQRNATNVSQKHVAEVNGSLAGNVTKQKSSANEVQKGTDKGAAQAPKEAVPYAGGERRETAKDRAEKNLPEGSPYQVKNVSADSPLRRLMGNIDPYVNKAKVSTLQLSQPQQAHQGPAAEGGDKAAADLLDALSGSSRSK